MQLSDDTREGLERLSRTTHRSATALATEAVIHYLDEQEWQIASIEEAVRLADDTDFISHEKISDWLKSWGTAEEPARPKPDVFKSAQ